MSKAYFITGTDTGAGKTYVTCAIAQSLRARHRTVGIYKPVCSGAVSSPKGPVWEDIENAFFALGGSVNREQICSQRFLAPLAPPVAARQEGRVVCEASLVDGFRVWLSQLPDDGILLVEGAGGWLSPLSDHWTCADFARQLNLPVIVVAAQKLGVINHSLLTLESIRRRELNPVAVILSSASPETDLSALTNAEEISRRGDVSAVFPLPYQGKIPEDILKFITD